MSKLLLDSLLLHLIILLLLPVSLLITLHDFSLTCKIYALLYKVSYALKKPSVKQLPEWEGLSFLQLV